jgi:diguanylate cyclase (GGDEF)-like protein
LISLLATGALVGIKHIGGLQALELVAFDGLVRSQPQDAADPRLLIVGITEADIQTQNQWPLSDDVIARLLAKLQQYQPRVIGLDLYRDVPHPPGHQALQTQLRAPNVVAITNLGDLITDRVPSPEVVPAERVGFNDLVIDFDGVARRNLMFAAIEDNHWNSFALQVSLRYLQNHSPDQPYPLQIDANGLQIGSTRFPRLPADAGGYRNVDNAGYQVLLRYRSNPAFARQTSLTQVLTGELDPAWARDKIVLIGTTALSEKDFFYTPYSAGNIDKLVMPGVLMHGQMTSQILSAVLDGRPLYRFWPQWGEILWAWLWAGLGSLLVWRLSRPLVLAAGGAVSLSGLVSVTYILFTQAIWAPPVLPALALITAGMGMLAYKTFYRTLYDPVTGLPNRAQFLHALKQALARDKKLQPSLSLAVLFLDLDRFQVINENFGHPIGDQLLQTIAQRIQHLDLPHPLAPASYLARLEGDEFAILLEKMSSEQTAIAWADEVQKALSQEIALSQRELVITASTGIALSQPDYDYQPEALLRDAQIAMYRAKTLGKARHEVFAGKMRTQSEQRFELETDLHQAIKREELRLHYQPLICLSTGRLQGFEALVRWQHPERGLVFPGDFISIAEENGLIVDLGYWVLKEACRQTHAWHQQFPSLTPLFISVNISGRQFAKKDLVEKIATILSETQLTADSLKLELTESVIMDDVDASVEALLRLKSLQLQLGVDDFGTGYSSLSCLHRFPIDTLKVDRSFVMRMEETADNAEIVKAIINLGHNLRMNLVAEGIETEGQAQQLQALGCEYGQGYLFAKPVPPEQATALLAQPVLWPAQLQRV